MSFTLTFGQDGACATAQVVWSVNGETYNFRSDNNFVAWISTIFTVADVVAGGGGVANPLVLPDNTNANGWSLNTLDSGGVGGSITMIGSAGDGGLYPSNAGTINLSAGLGGDGGSINLQGSQDGDEGNKSAGGSIDLSAGRADGGPGGSIISTGGSNGGGGGTLNMSGGGGNPGGSITMTGAGDGNGGNIDTSGGDGPGGYIYTGNGGGNIDTRGYAFNNGGSINTSANQGNGGGAGGSINTSGGNGGDPTPGGSINTSSLGGSINTSGSHPYSGGSINTYASFGADGGSINTNGGAYSEQYGGSGGSINTYGGSGSEFGIGGAGGNINMIGGVAPDGGSALDAGSIETSAGGGSIDTTGTGEIQFGYSGTRTTVVGSATADRTQTLPNESGTIAVINVGSVSIDFPNIPANSTLSQDVTVTGVAVGEAVLVTCTNARTGNDQRIIFTGFVATTPANTVTVLASNTGGAGVNLPSLAFKIIVFKGI